VLPFISWDQLDIPDLTDLERAAFADALARIVRLGEPSRSKLPLASIRQ
jgi:hypothetical protein